MAHARRSFAEIIRARRGEWLGVGAVALALALSYSWGGQLRRAMRGESVDWTLVPDATLVHFALWALLYPAVVVMAVRFPLGERRSRHVPIHVLAAFVFSPLLMTLTFVVRAALHDTLLSWRALLADAVVPELAWGLTAYLVLASAAHAVEYHRLQRRTAASAERLQAALVAARLECLRTQLQPHFLFNTLNLVSSLIRRDPEAAEHVVTRLGDFLRLTLEGEAPATITLERELLLLDGYLAIERARFRDRLSVRIDVTSSARDARVPYLLLQPLAENAVRHGIGTRAGPGVVTIRGRVRGHWLVLDVEDDGRSQEHGYEAATGRGLGLSNTRARLEHLFGPRRARVRVGPRRGGGTRARVILPRRTPGPGVEGVA